MNTSSCSDSSSLADGISSSAEAIGEAEATNNRKNSSPNLTGIRHSTPSKTGLRFIVASSDSEEDLHDLSKSSGSGNSGKCETTFSRTTFANNAGYPNCGTFFVQHVSEDEALYNLNSLDENENSSSAYASPNSIRKLVHGADQLVFLTPVDDSDVDYRPKGQSNLRPEVKTQRSHSFHASSKSLMSSDECDDLDDEMDCGRDSHNPSLKDASSLSQLVDSVVAEVHHSMLNEAISQDEDELLFHKQPSASLEVASTEEKTNGASSKLFLPESTTEAEVEKVVPKIIIDDVVRTNEEEELSDFWDQEKYLSEHNYDEPIDVDSTLKLLNFGDDYSKFIDSMSDEFSDLDQGTVKPQRTKRKIRRSTVKGSHYDSMSDSETDDAWKAVLLSRTKLNEVKQRLRNLEEEDQFTQNSVELTILKDVCYENIDCILKLLDESGAENSTVVVLKKTERSFKGLLKQWQEILQMIVQRLQLAETYGKIMDNVQKLETNLQKSKLPHEHEEQIFHRKEDLQQHIENLKTSLVDLSGQKSDLFRVNVEIHNFLAELSCCPGVVFNTPPSSLGRKDHSKQLLRSSQMMMTSDHNNPGSSEMMPTEQQHLYPHHLQHFPRPRKETSITQGLKDHVVGLYSKWDEAFHKTNTQLVNAQSTYANLLQFEIESKRLGNIKGNDSTGSGLSGGQRQQHGRRKKMDSLSLTEDSGISESYSDSEEAILTKMKLLAQDLEQKLSLDSNLVQEIALTLKTSTSDLEERLQVETTSVSRVHRLCAGTQTNNHVDDYDDDDEDFTVDHKSVNSWFKRIMRVALPVQFFLMVMLFFAWNSTDHHPHHGFFHSGCNGVSRFHFLYPELKYINGPPPI